jgi:hypothetical protein
MAFTSTEWAIDYGAKTVTNNDSGIGANLGNDTYIGPILEFFQWLATTFANSGQMDDEYPIESQTPTVYVWLNGWTFGHADDFKYLKGGSISDPAGSGTATADSLWSNLYTLGSQEAGTQLYIVQNDVELTPAWWGTGNIDVLILVKDAGVPIQSEDTTGVATNGGVWVYAREYGDEYDHGFANIYAGGRNPLGINTSADGSNTTLEATVQGWYDSAGFTVTFGTVSRDLNNGNGAQNYDVEIDCDSRPMTEVYEILKLATRHGEVTDDLNGDDGQEYRSASEGVYSEVKKAPFGTIAGTTMYGARGVWFTNYSAADFVLIDASGAVQSPPNYQKIIATHPDLDGSVSTDGGCYVFVAEISAGNIVKNQYTILGVTANTIQATAAININKAPQSGVLRVGDTKYAYTGFSGSTFTGVTPDPTGETGSFYVPLLDTLADATTEQSDNIIYNGDFSIRTSVRRYGTKPYDVDTTFTSAGRTFSPILTNDPQAT